MNKCLSCDKDAAIPLGLSQDMNGEVIAYRVFLCQRCYEILRLLRYSDIQEWVEGRRSGLL